jgi:DnaK suppressor protein
MPHTNEQFAAAKRRLEEEREALNAERAASREARQPVALDQQSVGRLSRMDAMQGQAMAQEAERRRIQRLHLIEAALRRIEEGDYGLCVECDEEIAPKRLDLDPAVATCIRCAGAK